MPQELIQPADGIYTRLGGKDTDLGRSVHLSGLVFNREKSLALKSEDKGLEGGSSAAAPALNSKAAVSSVKPVNDLRPTGLVSR